MHQKIPIIFLKLKEKILIKKQFISLENKKTKI